MPSSLWASADLQIRLLQVYAALLASAKACPQTDSPPPPSWSAYMSSAAALDCASTFHPHPINGTNQNTLHIVVFFPHPPLSSSPDAEINIQTMRDKHCVRCFAVVFHGGIFYKCIFVRARLAASSPQTAVWFPTCLHFLLPPAHKSLPYITAGQGDALHCTRSSGLCGASKQREMQRGKRGPTKMKEFFTWRHVWKLQILNVPTFRGAIRFAVTLLCFWFYQ